MTIFRFSLWGVAIALVGLGLFWWWLQDRDQHNLSRAKELALECKFDPQAVNLRTVGHSFQPGVITIGGMYYDPETDEKDGKIDCVEHKLRAARLSYETTAIRSRYEYVPPVR